MADKAALLDHFAFQAAACRWLGSPFTGGLLERMRADIEERGATATLLEGWEGSVMATNPSLRLCGALHAAALTERDPALAAAYPAADPDWSIDKVWAAAESFLAREHDWVADFIKQAPQTNETRRSIALLAGFLKASRLWGLPLNTLELGASAGLNLHWDQFRYRTTEWSWDGGGDVDVSTDWRGPSPDTSQRPQVVARAGCDLHPLDIRDPSARLRLRSYIWPDQAERLARFDAAADLAVAKGVQIDTADAAEWVARKLRERPTGVATIVYHSVFFQYPPPATRAAIRAAIETAGATATDDAPLGWLRLEPEAFSGGPKSSPRIALDLWTWPGGSPEILAHTDGHVTQVASQPALAL